MTSKRYKKIAEKVDKTKIYPIAEAIKLLKELASAKFDETVEAHVKLGVDTKKSDQAVRGMVTLPHGTGKSKKVAAFAENLKAEEAKAAGADIVGGEDLINEIKKKGKADFDVAVATPDIMKKMAPIAKILGPKGLMPSPKTETVTMDIAKAVKALKGGRIEFRSDNAGNVHLSLGKVSFESEKLRENYEEFIGVLKNSRPATAKGDFVKSAFLSSTMGPSIRINHRA